MNLIDTNIILRFLIADDPEMFEKTKKFFADLEKGKLFVDLELTVIFEVIYVLKSYYRKEKEEICNAVQKIVDLKNVRIKRKEIVKKMLSIWKNNTVGLVDSQLIALCERGQAKCVYSFDKGMDKFDAVNRLEPGE